MLLTHAYIRVTMKNISKWIASFSFWIIMFSNGSTSFSNWFIIISNGNASFSSWTPTFFEMKGKWCSALKKLSQFQSMHRADFLVLPSRRTAWSTWCRCRHPWWRRRPRRYPAAACPPPERRTTAWWREPWHTETDITSLTVQTTVWRVSADSSEVAGGEWHGHIVGDPGQRIPQRFSASTLIPALITENQPPLWLKHQIWLRNYLSVRADAVCMTPLHLSWLFPRPNAGTAQGLRNC